MRLVKICLELKRIFGSNIGILVNFGVKIDEKIENKNGEIFWRSLLDNNMVAKRVKNEVKIQLLQPFTIAPPQGSTRGQK